MKFLTENLDILNSILVMDLFLWLMKFTFMLISSRHFCISFRNYMNRSCRRRGVREFKK